MKVWHDLPSIALAAILCALLGACRSTIPPAHGLSVVSSPVDTNKEIARRFILAIPAKDATAMKAVLAPDAHLALAIAGIYSPELHAFPHGTQWWSRDELIRMEIDSQKDFAGPFSLQILSLIGEDYEVVAEVTGRGVRESTHRRYLQHFYYHFKMSRGQIEDIRLYQNTFELWDVFDNPGAPAQPPYPKAGNVDAAPIEPVPPTQAASSGSAETRVDDVAKNKAVVRRFLASVPAHDLQASLAAWASDGVWSWAVGGDYSPAAHTFEGAPRWNPAQLVAMHTAVQKALREPMTLDIYTIIGEGSYVSVEAVGILVRKNGIAYRQHYGIVFTMLHGKIVEVHEYQDTLHQYDAKLDHPSYAPVTPPSSNGNE